jgi:hypothetical protein
VEVEVEVTTRKRAAKSERDTAGRWTETETDRRQVSSGMCFCRLRLPFNLEAAGPCLRCRPKEGTCVSGVRKV